MSTKSGQPATPTETDPDLAPCPDGRACLVGPERDGTCCLVRLTPARESMAEAHSRRYLQNKLGLAEQKRPDLGKPKYRATDRLPVRIAPHIVQYQLRDGTLLDTPPTIRSHPDPLSVKPVKDAAGKPTGEHEPTAGLPYKTIVHDLRAYEELRRCGLEGHGQVTDFRRSPG